MRDSLVTNNENQQQTLTRAFNDVKSTLESQQKYMHETVDSQQKMFGNALFGLDIGVEDADEDDCNQEVLPPTQQQQPAGILGDREENPLDLRDSSRVENMDDAANNSNDVSVSIVAFCCWEACLLLSFFLHVWYNILFVSAFTGRKR